MIDSVIIVNAKVEKVTAEITLMLTVRWNNEKGFNSLIISAIVVTAERIVEVDIEFQNRLFLVIIPVEDHRGLLVQYERYATYMSFRAIKIVAHQSKIFFTEHFLWP